MKRTDSIIEASLDEVMSKVARMKRAMMMKTKAKMIARKRMIAMKRKASPEKLKKRAMKKARDILTQKLLKTRKKADLSISGKESLEKKLSKKKAVIAKIARKILPQVRKSESDRMAAQQKG